MSINLSVSFFYDATVTPKNEKVERTRHAGHRSLNSYCFKLVKNFLNHESAKNNRQYRFYCFLNLNS